MCVQVAKEVYDETAQLGLTLRTPLALGVLQSPEQDDHIYRMEATICFPQVHAKVSCLSCVHPSGPVHIVFRLPR